MEAGTTHSARKKATLLTTADWSQSGSVGGGKIASCIPLPPRLGAPGVRPRPPLGRGIRQHDSPHRLRRACELLGWMCVCSFAAWITGDGCSPAFSCWPTCIWQSEREGSSKTREQEERGRKVRSPPPATLDSGSHRRQPRGLRCQRKHSKALGMNDRSAVQITSWDFRGSGKIPAPSGTGSARC